MEVYLKDYIIEADTYFYLLEVHKSDYHWFVRKRFSQFYELDKKLGDKNFGLARWKTTKRLEQLTQFILYLHQYLHLSEIESFFFNDIYVKSTEDFHKIIQLKRAQYVSKILDDTNKIHNKDKNYVNILEIEIQKYKEKYRYLLSNYQGVLEESKNYKNKVEELVSDIERLSLEISQLKRRNSSLMSSSEEYVQTLKLYQDNINFFIDQIRDNEQLIKKMKESGIKKTTS